MASVAGQRVKLSLPRRFICDLLHASRKTPVITFERRVDLAAVVAARKRVSLSPPWAVLFAKALAIVAAHRPELRRTYLPLPWPHLWEAQETVVAVAVERQYAGDPGVFFGLLRSPNEKPLADLAVQVREWQDRPVEAVAPFNRALRYSRLPFPARRFLWWLATAWSGKVKAKNFGTVGVSLTGSSGSTATNLIAPVTAALNCGVFRPDGTADVRLHIDHRVLDGMTAARALADLEDVLRNEIVEELEVIAAAKPRRAVLSGLRE